MSSLLKTSRGRSAVIVDIENLLGHPSYWTDHNIARAWFALREALQLDSSDYVYIGSSAFMAQYAAFVIDAPNLRYLIRNGKDGAEIALTSHIDLNFIAEKYDSVMIASGDNYFADFAFQAQKRGLKVWQVAGRADTGRFLRNAAQLHMRLRLNDLSPAMNESKVAA